MVESFVFQNTLAFDTSERFTALLVSALDCLACTLEVMQLPAVAGILEEVIYTCNITLMFVYLKRKFFWLEAFTCEILHVNKFHAYLLMLRAINLKYNFFRIFSFSFYCIVKL